jgi:amino acid adenylation domain-containing protein
LNRKDELLAYLLKREGFERQSDYTIPLRDDDEAPPPLSFAQERFWFLDQFEHAHPVYNGCKVVRLIGQLSIEVLVECLNLIIRRHEVLRTTYPAPEGRPIARVVLACSVEIPITDLGHVSESELLYTIERLARNECMQPINLSEELPIRARLVRIGRAENLLFLTLHQIASDSQSVAIFFRELWSSYEAKLNGREPDLPALPVQYGDFASWQRRRVADQTFQFQREYWIQRLSGALPVLNLPTDKPRPPVQRFDGSRLSILLPETLQLRLKELSRESNVTLFMTLLAAFKTLLYRYTAQEDLLVGCAVLNRGLSEIENLLGSFLNTLVLRTSYAENLTFRKALQRVRQTCVGAFAHQDFPFEKLVEELQPERDLARNPIFQVMFTFQNASVPSLELAGLRSEVVEIDGGMTKFDLTFSLVDKEHGIAGHIEYSTDLFNRDTIERMVRHFQTLLEGIVADPDQSIATLPIMTEPERDQILLQWNDTTTDYPKDKCLHELFEAQVERTPDAVAVNYEGRQSTYQDLNRWSNQVAHYLMRSGVGPEKLVGIYAERSIKMVAGLLAILKAGGAYVPLEPTYPKERVMFMIKEAQLSLVLTEERLKFELEGYDGQVICVDSDWNEIAKQSVNNLTPVTKPDNLAYVMFTSGSTGVPKGVMITHGGISNRLLWMQGAYHLTESDRVLHKTPISFDVSVWEIFWPLLNGASVVVARPGGHQDHAYLAELIVQQKITVLHFVPSMLQVFLEQPRLDGCSDLRLVICSGETLSVDLQERFFARFDAELHNLYGPTEASIDVTSWACERRSNRRSVPIGRPIANTQIYILDSHMQPVPIGIPGDLYIGGDGLARGYLNRPELTAEKFVVNPISDHPQSRLYRTGDRARYLVDGNIEFLGRIDNQVKIRGYRIELGEIQAILNQHPAVKESVVIASSFPPPRRGGIRVGVTPSTNSVREEASQVAGEKVSESDRNLIAYLVSNTEKPSATELRRFLKEKLPEYMVPSFFVELDAFPLTPNGKIDLSALPAPDGERSQLDQGFVEPRTEIEELIAQVWREILQLDKIGVHDNFFELGGHSLLATRVVARLRAKFNIDLPLQKLFELPTVAELAAHINFMLRSGSGVLSPPIMPAPRDQRNLPSIGQESLLFLNELIPNTHLFNIPAVYRLRGPLDVEILARSLNCLIMRQEALRTTFPLVDGQRMLLVKDHLRADLSVVDLQSLSETEFESQAEKLAREEVIRPFNLGIGPLFRTNLLRHSKEHHVLVVTAHHVISDAWSMIQFFKELGLHYEYLLNGRPSSLKGLSIQFADFACWQRQAVDQGSMQSQLAYWQKELAGPLVPLTFTEIRGPLKELSFRTGRKAVSITGKTLQALNRLSRAQGCTTFITLLTTFKVLLYSYTSQEDIRVATLVANRSRDEVQELIGHFVDTIVLRTRVSADRTFAQLQARVRETTLAGLNNDELPFESLLKDIESTRNLDRSAVAQVMLVHQSSPVCPIQLPGIAAEVIDYGLREQDNVTITSFDLILFLKERGSQLLGSLIYKSDLFGEEFVDQMLDRFYIILERACANPHVIVGELCDSLRSGGDRPLTRLD